jgi:signal transduction histidine kinase
MNALNTICKEIIQNNNAQLTIDIEPTIKNLQADENLLNQVLVNLIKNAAEAPKSGKEKEINIGIKQSKNLKTQITVSNNGLNIEPDVLDKIFIPFFTTKEDGAGIGLYVCRQIIHLHQGTLTVYSKEKENTRFIIEL